MSRFNKNFTLLCLLPCTLLMMVLMAKTGATLKTQVTPKGIIDLEFAYSGAKASAIINSWANTGAINNVSVAKINTWFDFIFLFCYSLLLYNACKLVAGNFKGFLFSMGQIIARGALAAGICDVLENAGMLLALHGYISDAFTMLTFIFSTAKWILALAAVLYAVAGGFVLFYRKISVKVSRDKKASFR